MYCYVLLFSFTSFIQCNISIIRILPQTIPNNPKQLIGPSGVRALPVAAGMDVVARLLAIIFLSFSDSLTSLPERRQLGLPNFAWAPHSQKY